MKKNDISSIDSMFLDVKNIVLSAICFSFISVLLIACGGEGNQSLGAGNSESSSLILFQGVAQKGPFVKGSIVQLSQLDLMGSYTGKKEETKVFEKNGEFSFKLPESWRIDELPVQIDIEGYYLDESTGKTSKNKVHLSSIFMSFSSDSRSLNSVNLLTYWVAKRAKVLVNAKQHTLFNGIKQAEEELNSIFRIKHFQKLDISQSEKYPEDNALLLLLSGALLDTANEKNIHEQIIIDDIANDFSRDGKLTEKGDVWFLRMQALIRDNPSLHVNQYAAALNNKIAPRGKLLPKTIPLATRPTARVPNVLNAEIGEIVILDGSESFASANGKITNYTWTGIANDITLSDRFIAKPSITLPDEEVVLQFSLMITSVDNDRENKDKQTDTAVVRVVVKDPEKNNTTPIAYPQTIETDEDKPVLITLTGSDADGDILSYILSASNNNVTDEKTKTFILLPFGILEKIAPLDKPTYKYTPTKNFSGTDSFKFWVKDRFKTSKPAIVKIIVNPVNDPPIANGQNIVTDEDTPIDITLVGTDVDNAIDFIDISEPLNGVLEKKDSEDKPIYIYTPNSNYSGIDSFTFRVFDGVEESEPATVNITVNPIDDLPIADSQSITTNEDTSIEVTLTGSDTDNEISFINISKPLNGVLEKISSEDNGVYQYIPNSNFFGTDYFTFEVEGGGKLSKPATVEITVNPIDDLPIADSQNVTTNEDTAIDITLTGSDTDNEISFINISKPLNGVLEKISSEDNGVYQYIPNSNFFGIDHFTFEIEGGGKLSKPATVEITVNPIDDLPIADSQNVTTNEDISIEITLTGSDIDNPISFIEPLKPSHGTLKKIDSDNKAAVYRYTPNLNFYGTDSFTFSVKGGDKVSEPATVKIIVTSVNDAPIANAGIDQIHKVPYMSSLPVIKLSGTASDPEGDMLTYSWIFIQKPIDTSPTLDNPNTLNPSFTPAEYGGYEQEEYRLQLTVTDSHNAQTTSTVKITVIYEY